MANNLPISVVRDMGADVVIAVDISSLLLTEEELNSVLNVSLQLTNFLTRKNTKVQLASLSERDILIVPDLTGVSSGEFSKFESVIELGYSSATQSSDQLATLSGDRPPTHHRVAEMVAKDYIVHFIELDNGSVLDDEIIYSRIDLPIGESLDMSSMESSLDQIYALDLFQTVTYDLVTDENGDTGVLISAHARSWGPNYMQF